MRICTSTLLQYRYGNQLILEAIHPVGQILMVVCDFASNNPQFSTSSTSINRNSEGISSRISAIQFPLVGFVWLGLDVTESTVSLTFAVSNVSTMIHSANFPNAELMAVVNFFWAGSNNSFIDP